MSSEDWTMGMILTQTVAGILGNFCLLSFYICLYFSGCRLRCTDLIIKHLIVANSLFLLFRAVPQFTEALGFRHFISDLGCKLLFYVHRVGRGMSFSGMCLLNVFQAIIISPRDFRWAELKAKALMYTGTCVFLCWILHMLVNIIVALCATAISVDINITKRSNIEYFSGHNDEINDYVINAIIAALLSFPDVLCLWIMPWASDSMVFILYRHKQRFQHLHGKSPSPKSSSESRATKTVLLVSTFASLYTLSFTMHIWWAVSGKLLAHLSALTNACFPALSPFILMSRDANVSRFCWSRTSPSVLRIM